MVKIFCGPAHRQTHKHTNPQTKRLFWQKPVGTKRDFFFEKLYNFEKSSFFEEGYEFDERLVLGKPAIE